MIQYVVLALALCVSYAIPVAGSLALAMAVGSMSPRFIARRGRLQPIYILLEGLVWLLCTVVSGYLIAYAAPFLPWVFCGVVIIALAAMLWGNASLMRKRRSALLLAGMTIATVGGTILGSFLYLNAHR